MAATGVSIGFAAAICAALPFVILWLMERRRRRAVAAELVYAAAARQLAAKAETAERKRAEYYREVLDALPIPVWRRAQDLTLVTIPEANHFVQQDAAELVTSTMRWWLEMRR